MKILLQILIGMACGALGVLAYNYFHPKSGLQKAGQLKESQQEKKINAFYQKLMNGQFSDPVEGVQELERLSFEIGEAPRFYDSTGWFPLKRDSLVLVPYSTAKCTYYNISVAMQVSSFGKTGNNDKSDCLERVLKYRNQAIGKLKGEPVDLSFIGGNIERELRDYALLTNEGMPISRRINHFRCNMAGEDYEYTFNLKRKYEILFEELINIFEKQLLENKIEINDSKAVAESKAKNLIRLFFLKDIGNENYEYRYLSTFASAPDMQVLITTTVLGHNCPMKEPLVDKYQQKLQKLHDIIKESGENAFELLKKETK